MAFFTTDTPASMRPPFGLSQRGRSSLEILGAIQKFSSSHLRQKAREQFESKKELQSLSSQHGKDCDRDAVKANVTAARDIAYTIPAFRLERFSQAYVALQIFARGIPAVEERREQFEKFMDDNSEISDVPLEFDDSAARPKYYDIEWHLEPDGWDGYDLYGPVFAFAVGPLVFKHGGYAALNVGDDLAANRKDVLAALPKKSYERIYEPGCGGGTTIATIAELFPNSEIVGSDLSPLLLRMAQKLSQRQGLKVHLKQREVTQTGEAADSVDAIVTYALHHELPPKENIRLFNEMFRIMKPGADFVIGDPPPFREVDLFQAVILDWDTKNRGEPFFSANLLEDWDQALQEVGFTDVKSYSTGAHGFPWIISGKKPDTTAEALAA